MKFLYTIPNRFPKVKFSNECSEGYFQCKSGGVCITVDYVCDGEMDCMDGSDEWKCSENAGNANLAPYSATNLDFLVLLKFISKTRFSKLARFQN